MTKTVFIIATQGMIDMKLAGTLHSPRRGSIPGTAALRGLTGGRFGRSRAARMFPAEAERLVTAAELRQLTS